MIEPAEDIVRVCLGPRCAARGSERLVELLKGALRDRGLEGRIRVLQIQGFCHGRCNLGPNLFAGRAGDWYAGVQEGDLAEIIELHLVNGSPVQRLLGKLPDALTLDDKLPWD